MRVYTTKKGQLILSPNKYERYGVFASDTIQIKDSKLTRQIEDEVRQAMEAIIKKYEPHLEGLDLESLFKEQQKQRKQSDDFETRLTNWIEENVK